MNFFSIYTYKHTYRHTHTHTHTHMHVYIHDYMHPYMHTCVHTYISIYIHTYTHTHMHTYTYIHTSEFLYFLPIHSSVLLIYSSARHHKIHKYQVFVFIFPTNAPSVGPGVWHPVIWKLHNKEMFYLTTHSTHFIYSYMASFVHNKDSLLLSMINRDKWFKMPHLSKYQISNMQTFYKYLCSFPFVINKKKI